MGVMYWIHIPNVYIIQYIHIHKRSGTDSSPQMGDYCPCISYSFKDVSVHIKDVKMCRFVCLFADTT